MIGDIRPGAEISRPGCSGLLAGVDIGGTTTQVVLCDVDLQVVAHAEAPTPALVSGDAMAATAASLVHSLVAVDGRALVGVGVGAAGVVDAVSGRILVASDSFVGWSGFPLTSVLARDLGAPTFLDNDVNAFLRGEISTGSIAGVHEALGITLGTGVGGALWIGGSLWEGPRGAAGEIGHIPGFGDALCTCGGRGHLETLASGRSIARRYATRAIECHGVRHTIAEALEPLLTGSGSVTARDVAAFAMAGDEDALTVLTDAAEAVAHGILITAGLLDVTTVVVGGGVSHSWPLLGQLVREALDRQPPVSGAAIRLELSGLGAHAVALGAAARARAELAPAT